MKQALKYLTLLIIPFILIKSYHIFQSESLVIAMIVLYGLFDFRYPLLFIPSLIISPSIAVTSIILIMIGLAVLLRRFYSKNLYFSLGYLGLTLIISSGIRIIFFEYNLYLLLGSIFISMVIFFFQIKTLNYFRVLGDNIIKALNIKRLQAITCIILATSAVGFNQDYFLLIEIILIFYLTRLNIKGFSLVLAIFTFLLSTYYLNYQHGIVFLLLAIIYLLPKYYPLLITISLIAVDYFFYHFLNQTEILIIIGTSLAYELFKLIHLDYFEKRTSILNMYDNVINNFNDQVLKFASFLDEFERKFITDRETQVKMSESYSYLINTFCGKCEKRNNCLIQHKNEAYLFLKSCLLYGNSIMVKRDKSLTLDFINGCPYHDEIIIKANIMKNKYNFNKEKSKNEQALTKQIIGVSNTLRQYVVDLSSKREMHLEMFLDFKNSLIDSGYKIMLFNVRRIFKNDFWIELGLHGASLDEVKDIVKREAEKRLHTKVSLEIKSQSSDCVYFSIVPYIAINILYGHGAITKDSLNIGGDNYMIKDLDTGIFIAAISDGMGSGYKAYTESKETLELLDKITEFEVNPNTSINMLNTFYSLKENMDQYATLDFLEINKSSREAILFKMGSSNTYLVRNSHISVIYNQNLPFGINDLITKDEFMLEDQDCIILASDGINDNITDSEMEQAILLSLHKSPQEMAYDILNKIIMKEKKALDDMSIVVLKIEKCAA